MDDGSPKSRGRNMAVSSPTSLSYYQRILQEDQYAVQSTSKAYSAKPISEKSGKKIVQRLLLKVLEVPCLLDRGFPLPPDWLACPFWVFSSVIGHKFTSAKMAIIRGMVYAATSLLEPPHRIAISLPLHTSSANPLISSASLIWQSRLMPLSPYSPFVAS